MKFVYQVESFLWWSWQSRKKLVYYFLQHEKDILYLKSVIPETEKHTFDALTWLNKLIFIYVFMLVNLDLRIS